MIVSMYSSKPLPLEIRSSFELPAWPYNEKFFDKFANYMRKLNVFRYEDNQMVDGKQFIGHPINIDKIAIIEPLDAFFSIVAVRDKDLKVVNWPGDNPEGNELLLRLDMDPIARDRKAWFFWNAPVRVLSITDNGIEREMLHEKINTFCDERGCFKYGADKFKNQRIEG